MKWGHGGSEEEAERRDALLDELGSDHTGMEPRDFSRGGGRPWAILNS